MPRVCTACTHAERTAIDEALVKRSGSLRDVAERFRLSKTAVARHKSDHLPDHLRQAKEVGEVASASALLEQMQSLQLKTLTILAKAKDQRTALAAVREARGNVQLLALPSVECPLLPLDAHPIGTGGVDGEELYLDSR